MEIFGSLTSRRRAVKTLLASAFPLALLKAREPEEVPLHFFAKTIDGDKLSSDSLKGKVVLLNFWATWCPYCKDDERALEKVTKDFEDKGLVVLSVDMGEPRRKVKKYLEEHPRVSKVVLAEDTTLAAICEAKTYPLYVLIDREGDIIGRRHGATGERGLRSFLTRAGLADS